MNYTENFKRRIEYPINKLATVDIRSKEEAELVFWKRIELQSIIARTIRLCLQCPDLAKEYLDSLPKVTIE